MEAAAFEAPEVKKLDMLLPMPIKAPIALILEPIFASVLLPPIIPKVTTNPPIPAITPPTAPIVDIIPTALLSATPAAPKAHTLPTDNTDETTPFQVIFLPYHARFFFFFPS